MSIIQASGDYIRGPFAAIGIDAGEASVETGRVNVKLQGGCRRIDAIEIDLSRFLTENVCRKSARRAARSGRLLRSPIHLFGASKTFSGLTHRLAHSPLDESAQSLDSVADESFEIIGSHK